MKSGLHAPMRRGPARAAALLAAVVLAATPRPATAQDGAPAAISAGQDERAALAARFQATLDSLWSAAQQTDEIFPGATAAYITPEGEVFAFATGYSDINRRIEMEPDMRMPSGSVGKTYVAATAISMALDGVIDLDDHISRWIGDRPWFERLPNGPDITIRHLLTHAGGLIDHAFDSEEFVAAVRGLVARANPDATLSPEQLVEFVLDREPLFPAGLGYNYTDTGYIIVGLVIEEAAGASYYDELRRRILVPLELDMTHPQDSREAPRLAQGYAAASAEIFGTPLEMVGADGRMVLNPAIEWTGGGLYNNPQSMVRWARLLYEGDAFEGDYVGDLLESAVRGASPVPRSVYSLGVTITQTPLGITYGHSGFFPGYNSGMLYFPAVGAAIALQINTDASRGADHLQTLSRVLIEGLRADEESDMHEFDAVIEEGRGGGAAIAVPFDAKEVFGSGRPRVAVTFDGVAYRGSIASMGGRYMIGVRKDIRTAIGKGPGDTVRVRVELDTAPRTVTVPDDLAAALAEAGLRDAFDRLSYTHRREHVEAVEETKRPETRARRIARALEMLAG